MNSFTLTAIGQLSRDPEMMSKDDALYTRFCLLGTDYGGKDKGGAVREVVTGVYFVAFGALGEVIALHARKGDQLIVTAQLRTSHWTDREGHKRYSYSFVVRGFRFGAPGRVKRMEMAERASDEALETEPETADASDADALIGTEPESEDAESIA